ncbi:MAG TPA: hypothetical protein VEU55_08085 [Gemmatimonadales bacterium]|nr:hypothetical protein [Gemmatimonadales bacterium]
MRWLCFLLLASQAPLAAQSAGATPLRFDLTAIPATRDSFVFLVQDSARGWAVWQYEIRSLETRQEVLYTAASELQPVEEERLRVVLDRLTGRPVATFHHLEFFSPTMDTVMLEHDLAIERGEISGRRRVGMKSGEVKLIPVRKAFPAGTVLAEYELYASGVTNAAPGDSLTVRAYDEWGDSLLTINFVAEAPTTIDVPAGRFDVLPLRTGRFRLYTTRTAPRRVVKGMWLDHPFAFELVHVGPVVPTRE